jgi:hypothetical protein
MTAKRAAARADFFSSRVVVGPDATQQLVGCTSATVRPSWGATSVEHRTGARTRH